MPRGIDPLFRKPTYEKKLLVEAEMPRSVVDEVISELLKDEALTQKMLQYIRLARGNTVLIDEAQEVLLRREIFPTIDRKVFSLDVRYSIFSGDVAEELFRRLEKTIGEGG